MPMRDKSYYYKIGLNYIAFVDFLEKSERGKRGGKKIGY